MNNPQGAAGTPGTKTDITNLTIDRFLLGLNLLRNKKQTVYRLATVKITEEDKNKIREAINRRNSANQARGIMEITKLQRDEKHKVDEKGLSGEVVFSKVIQKIYNNATLPEYEVKTPVIAETGKHLDKSTQDYVIKSPDPEQSLNFDMKAQSDSSNSINVNMDAFARMKEQKADFMIVGLMKWDNQNLDTLKEMDFYYLDVDFFEKNSQAVTKFKNPKCTPFRAFPMEKLKGRTQ